MAWFICSIDFWWTFFSSLRVSSIDPCMSIFLSFIKGEWISSWATYRSYTAKSRVLFVASRFLKLINEAKWKFENNNNNKGPIWKERKKPAGLWKVFLLILCYGLSDDKQKHHWKIWWQLSFFLRFCFLESRERERERESQVSVWVFWGDWETAKVMKKRTIKLLTLTTGCWSVVHEEGPGMECVIYCTYLPGVIKYKLQRRLPIHGEMNCEMEVKCTEYAIIGMDTNDDFLWGLFVRVYVWTRGMDGWMDGWKSMAILLLHHGSC